MTTTAVCKDQQQLPPTRPRHVLGFLFALRFAHRSVSTLGGIGAALIALPMFASSYYTSRPVDARAVYLTSADFAVQGDGIADDSAALQQAIDRVQEKTNQGLLFIPSGRYRVSRTIYIWPGIRLIGFGTTRPVFVLAANTPGFQRDPAYMFFFAGARPKGNEPPPDANPGTFYSALSNLDFEIGDGNPSAVAVRAHYAQHCFLAHIDFHVGSGLAAIHDGGNVAQDVHFYGGRYGIWTRKPSPGWQFTILDATFEGQREAAIREHEAGLTLIRPQFKRVPTAISIDAGYSDELWIKDARFEEISGPALIISNENSARTEINAEHVDCHSVPVFAMYRESGKHISGPSEIYQVRVFSHGLHYEDIGSSATIEDVFDTAPLAALPAPITSDIPDLPPMNTWVNIRSLGAAGDGTTDDTTALRKAIAQYRTIYLPSGQYRVSDTISLKPDTVLIGLHPSVTRILIADSTPAFQGVGNPKAVLETPPTGTNIVTGIGLYTNGINPRAVAARWRAGSDSLMNDVRFLGGHGTVDPNASAEDSRKAWREIYNNTHTADSNLDRRWDGQYPSLWITGGGTFVDIWTPSTFAQAGLYISNTSTPGRVYELSSEHHVRYEVVLDHASNWQIYGLQTEEERGESGFALPLDIRDSSNITFANLHMYRVVSSYQPFKEAVSLTNSSNIRFRNLHCYSDSKVSFDDAIYDATHNVEIRQREFAWLTAASPAPEQHPLHAFATLIQDAHVEKLATGFFNVSGGAVDRGGDLYFVDAKWQTIYRWSAGKQTLTKVRDAPLDPVQLFFDKSGDLMVVSYAGNGTVYSFRPDSTDRQITLIQAVPAQPRPEMTSILPVDYWRNENDFVETVPQEQPYQYISPDGTTFLPADQNFVSGKLYYGSKLNNTLRAFGLARTTPGHPFYVSDENGEKTYVAQVDDSGTISSLKLFAERGGESVASDEAGNVYIAAGQVFVYNPKGDCIDTIEVPERPSQLLFGGQDGRTLFILARSSLYAIKTLHKGL
jgi:Pectate lyase superfamily protein/SMP-30/Gluconolactonase/LRE-like region